EHPGTAGGAPKMEKMKLGGDGQLKTEAMKNFEANFEPLEGLVRRLIPNEVSTAVRSFERELKRWQKLSPPSCGFPLTREVGKLTASVNNWISVQRLSFEWMSVMVVSLLEGYLEDGLISLATKNPKLMKDAPPIDHHRVLEVSSIEDLRNEVRQ